MQKAKKSEEMERVLQVFDQYLKASPCLEWLWSEKLGYILMQICAESSEIVESRVMEDAQSFCRVLLREIAQNVLTKTEKEHDINEADVLEQTEIKKRWKPYIDQLPEYAFLCETLLERP